MKLILRKNSDRKSKNKVYHVKSTHFRCLNSVGGQLQNSVTRRFKKIRENTIIFYYIAFIHLDFTIKMRKITKLKKSDKKNREIQVVLLCFTLYHFDLTNKNSIWQLEYFIHFFRLTGFLTGILCEKADFFLRCDFTRKIKTEKKSWNSTENQKIQNINKLAFFRKFKKM